MKATDVIIRELTPEEIRSRMPFAHFGWEGTGAFSFSTISDGYWNGAKVIFENMKENANNFAIVDSLVYPLFFNYRHSVETYLKLLYFKFGEQTDQARKDYLEKGHNLQSLWAILRPYLNKGKKHVGCSIDFNVIEHYINVLNKFDSESMVMRYPIEKDLTSNKLSQYHFDYINFANRMDELCYALRRIDDELSNQMNGTASLEELNQYIEMFEKYLPQINEFIELLKIDIAKEPKPFKASEFFGNLKSYVAPKYLQFLNDCDGDLLILLDNLFYAGRSVREEIVRLSQSMVGKQREFVKLCNILLSQDGLKFGIAPNDSQINIFGKTSSSLLENISTAISILTLSE